MRPGSVIEIDKRSPPVVFHHGEGFRLERLPLGSRVVYPPSTVASLPDTDDAIRAALLRPAGMDPLPALLRRGMKLTIAFDDISLPLPPMRSPDIRQRVLEIVLQMAADAGVDDIKLIVGNSLHRRMTGAEIKEIVGPRVFSAFWPEDLYNHDAEDEDNIVFIGETDQGEVVELNKRAAESDLLIYVNINLVSMDGGHKSIAVGLGTYRSLRHHHNVSTMMESKSYMDPRHSALHHSANRQGRLLEQAVPCFHIETTLNNAMYTPALDFLQKPEWLWTRRDAAAFYAAKQATEAAPRRLVRKIFHAQKAPYGVTGVFAGEAESVHERTLRRLFEQQAVRVTGQTDVLTVGLPYICPYNVHSIMNPILVMCLGLGYLFNLYRHKPLVRPGGVMILTHPVPREFHPVHHPSYIDFYEQVLSVTTDPREIEAKFEEDFAHDPWYRQLYRTGNAYHGVHPFYMWYWGCYALDYLGDVIFVGAERDTVRRMGFRTASTLEDALEMAETTVGPQPTLTHLHVPPIFLADVE
jgi:lactate racemase-like protein